MSVFKRETSAQCEWDEEESAITFHYNEIIKKINGVNVPVSLHLPLLLLPPPPLHLLFLLPHRLLHAQVVVLQGRMMAWMSKMMLRRMNQDVEQGTW